MNNKRLAQALNTISVGFAEAAEALNAESANDPLPPYYEATYVGPGDEPQPTLADQSVDFAPQGSLSQCPKHHSSYLPSKFKEGKFYCPANTDDPAWSNSKGKCRITPDNAAEYLRIKAAA